MKIVTVNQFYVPDVAPTGVKLHDLCRALVEAGHHVTVICSAHSYDGGGKFSRHEQRDGVSVRRLPTFGFGRRSLVCKVLDYFSFYFCLLFALLWIRPRPDLILGLTTPPYVGALVKMAARLRRSLHAHWIMDVYPDVMVAHGMIRDGGFLHRRLSGLMRFMLRGSCLSLTLGPDMAERVARYCSPGRGNAAAVGSMVEWVPLWSDKMLCSLGAEDVSELRAERGWANDDVVLMYSGNMGLGHSMSEFIDAIRSGHRRDRLRWAFAGGGKRLAELKSALAGEEGKGARAEILPYVPAELLCTHLCSADVHLASLEPAWKGNMIPSKIQAIFAVGRPVIFVGPEDSSIGQWIRESGGGWIVPSKDPQALAAAMDEALLPAERKTRGEAARQFAEKHFDASVNCRRIIDLLVAGADAAESGKH